MLVKDVISMIESKGMTVKELAEKYNKSDRTIQNKIKNLGYKWDPTNAKYNFIGEGSEPLDINFDSLFDSKSKSSNAVKSNVSNKSVNKIKNDSSKNSSEKSINASIGESDLIDKILFGDEQNERTYKGYYFDEDVLNILETKVPRGKKSDFLNEVLRKIFKEKGLL